LHFRVNFGPPRFDRGDALIVEQRLLLRGGASAFGPLSASSTPSRPASSSWPNQATTRCPRSALYTVGFDPSPVAIV
jgi:hypothetical protein